MSDIINKAGMCGKGVKYVTTQPFLFCFSMVKSEPTWLRPEKFQFEARKKKKKRWWWKRRRWKGGGEKKKEEKDEREEKRGR